MRYEKVSLGLGGEGLV